MFPINNSSPTASGSLSQALTSQEYFNYYQKSAEHAAKVLSLINNMPAENRVELLKSALFNEEVGPTNMLMQCDTYRLADLRNISFNNKNLAQINLSQLLLSGSQLQYCTLNHASFSGSTIPHVNFSGSLANSADFKRCHAEKANFSQSSLNSADFTEANCTSASFENAQLNGITAVNTRFDKSNMRNTNLSASDCRQASFHSANLQGADLMRSDLTGADFRCAELKNAQLNFTNLSGANFHSANLNGCEIEGAYLDRAMLENISALNTTFHGCNMEGTHLSFSLPTAWTPSNIELYFNIFDSDETLLTTLGSIDEEYHPLKQQLLKQVIDSLQGDMDALSPAATLSFIEAIGRSPLILHETQCHSFMAKLMDDFLSLPMDKQRLARYSREEFTGENLISGLIILIESMPKDKQRKIMLENNTFFYRNDKGRFNYPFGQ